MCSYSHTITYSGSTVTIDDSERIETTVVTNCNVTAMCQNQSEIVDFAIAPNGN